MKIAKKRKQQDFEHERIFNTPQMRKLFIEADNWLKNTPRRSMTLEEMLAEIPEPRVLIDRDWENVEPVGREAWSREFLEAEAVAMEDGIDVGSGKKTSRN